MKYINLILLTFVLMTPVTALANWYWLTIPENPGLSEVIELSPAEYAVTHINKQQLTEIDGWLAEMFLTLDRDSFEILLNAKKSELCSNQYDKFLVDMNKDIAEFDSNNEYSIRSCQTGFFGTPISCNEWDTNTEAVAERKVFIESYIARGVDNLNSCLKTEVREREEVKIKVLEEARKAAIVEAVASCDFDFFDTMTTPEKMSTFDGRKACVTGPEKAVEEIIEPAAEAVVLPTPDTLSAETPVITPQPDPVTPAQVPNTVQTESGLAVETATVEESFDEVTTTPETAAGENTQAEENSVTSEQITESETSPSFFQRIISFFTSWF